MRARAGVAALGILAAACGGGGARSAIRATASTTAPATLSRATTTTASPLAAWRATEAPLLGRLEADGLRAPTGMATGAYEGATRDCRDMVAVVAELTGAPAPPTSAAADALTTALAYYDQAGRACLGPDGTNAGAWGEPLYNGQDALQRAGLWVPVP